LDCLILVLLMLTTLSYTSSLFLYCPIDVVKFLILIKTNIKIILPFPSKIGIVFLRKPIKWNNRKIVQKLLYTLDWRYRLG